MTGILAYSHPYARINVECTQHPHTANVVLPIFYNLLEMLVLNATSKKQVAIILIIIMLLGTVSYFYVTCVQDLGLKDKFHTILDINELIDKETLIRSIIVGILYGFVFEIADRFNISPYIMLPISSIILSSIHHHVSINSVIIAIFCLVGLSVNKNKQIFHTYNLLMPLIICVCVYYIQRSIIYKIYNESNIVEHSPMHTIVPIVSLILTFMFNKSIMLAKE